MPKAKNLETGVISNVGPNFLGRQPKPFIAPSGKYYADGVWVEYKDPPPSKEATKIIDQAKQPGDVKAEGGQKAGKVPAENQ